VFLSRLIDRQMAKYKSLDKRAIVFQEINQRLLERLGIIKIQPKTIVNLFSGIPYVSRELAGLYPNADIFLMGDDELAIKYAQKSQKLASSKLQTLVYPTLTELPLAKASVDLLVANLLLPWSTDLKPLLAEIRRLLKPGGLFIFSSLGPDTLKELTTYLPANFSITIKDNLLDMHVIGDLLMQEGLSEPVMEMEMLQVNYRKLSGLVDELSCLNLLSLPKTTLNSSNAQIAVSFEVIYGHAWQPTGIKAGTLGESYIAVDMIKRPKPA